MSFAKWTSIFFVTYAACEAAFVTLTGIALHLSFRSLVMPYLILLCCPLVIAPLIYWARLSYDRPKAFAIRFASSIFVGAFLLMSGLAFDAVKLGIISTNTVLNNFAPYFVPGAAIPSLMLYVAIRKKRESEQQSSTMS